jgi:hypothetical protein
VIRPLEVAVVETGDLGTDPAGEDRHRERDLRGQGLPRRHDEGGDDIRDTQRRQVGKNQ